MSLKLNVKIHAEGLNPLYKSMNNDWIPLYAAEEVIIQKGRYKKIPLSISMEIPEGYEVHIVEKKDNLEKFKIMKVGGVSVVDSTCSTIHDIWDIDVYATKSTVIPFNAEIAKCRVVHIPKDIEFVNVSEKTLEEEMEELEKYYETMGKDPIYFLQKLKPEAMVFDGVIGTTSRCTDKPTPIVDFERGGVIPIISTLDICYIANKQVFNKNHITKVLNLGKIQNILGVIYKNNFEEAIKIESQLLEKNEEVIKNELAAILNRKFSERFSKLFFYYSNTISLQAIYVNDTLSAFCPYTDVEINGYRCVPLPFKAKDIGVLNLIQKKIRRYSSDISITVIYRPKSKSFEEVKQRSVNVVDIEIPNVTSKSTVKTMLHLDLPAEIVDRIVYDDTKVYGFIYELINVEHTTTLNHTERIEITIELKEVV